MRETYKLGQTTVIVDDSCCVKTQEEIDAILRRIGEIWYNDLLKKEVRRIKQEKER